MAQSSIARYKLVVIGGSAGSLDIMLRIAADIPANTQISFILVLHRKSGQHSIFTELLSDKTKLPVKEVKDKEPILPGTIYVAPCDYHLLPEHDHTFSLAVGMKAISRHGGFTIVQLPATAEIGYMPQQALNIMAPVKVLDSMKIAHFLHGLLSSGK